MTSIAAGSEKRNDLPRVVETRRLWEEAKDASSSGDILEEPEEEGESPPEEPELC